MLAVNKHRNGSDMALTESSPSAAGLPNGTVDNSHTNTPNNPKSSINRRNGWSFPALLQNAIYSTRVMVLGEPGEIAWFNLMFIFFPLAFISKQYGWSDGATFGIALLAMMPLAERLGFCTEALADHTNDTLGGLMNATMGNAPELIISIFALRDGLLRVVQVSLLGSILSNLLLVLGTGFLLGGLRHRDQRFNSSTSHLNAGLLLLATTCLLLPAVLVYSNTQLTASSGLLLSRLVSIVMLLTYCAFLFFQLHTHAHLFVEDDVEEEAGDARETQRLVIDTARANQRSPALSIVAGGTQHDDDVLSVTERGETNSGRAPLAHFERRSPHTAPSLRNLHAASNRSLKLSISKRSLHTARAASPRPSAAHSLSPSGASSPPMKPFSGSLPSRRNILLGNSAMGDGSAIGNSRRNMGNTSTRVFAVVIDEDGTDEDEGPATNDTNAGSPNKSTHPSNTHASRPPTGPVVAVPHLASSATSETAHEMQGAEATTNNSTNAGNGEHLTVNSTDSSNSDGASTSSGVMTSLIQSGANTNAGATSNSSTGGGSANAANVLSKRGEGSTVTRGQPTLAAAAKSSSGRNLLKLTAAGGGSNNTSPVSQLTSSTTTGAGHAANAVPTNAPGAVGSSSMRQLDTPSPSSLRGASNSLGTSAVSMRDIELTTAAARRGPSTGVHSKRSVPETASMGVGVPLDTTTTTMNGSMSPDIRAHVGLASSHNVVLDSGHGAKPYPSSSTAVGEHADNGSGVENAREHPNGEPTAHDEAGDDEEDEPALGLYTSLIWLCLITACIASLSEVLVSSISGASNGSGLSEMFVSAILLPIAGNAAEHASAVIFAMKNRLDISLGVAVGSSMQISLFVAPFLVLLGWMIGQPLSLDFQLFETATVIATVLIVNFLIIDGRSNWMIGMLLVAAYVVVALSFAMHAGSGTV